MSLYDVTEAAGLLSDEPELLGPAEAARLLGVAPSTLRGYVRRGLLRPAANLGSDKARGARWAFRRADLLRFEAPTTGRPRKA